MASTFREFPHTAYKISKAALNMLTLQYAHAFADQGFAFTLISPGVSRIPIYPPRPITVFFRNAYGVDPTVYSAVVAAYRVSYSFLV